MLSTRSPSRWRRRGAVASVERRNVRALGRVGSLDIFDELAMFRACAFDVVLSAVPFTRAILDEVGPTTLASSFAGDRVRSIGDQT